MARQDKLTASREIRIPSTAAIYHHPIHPMLVTFPIAFLSGGLLTDLIFIWTGDTFWAKASFWLLAAGFVGGTAAAIFGTTDFLTIPAIRQKIRGWGHFMAAIIVLSFAAANIVLRWDDPLRGVLPWGVFLSAITMIMLAVAGYLGGKLVFHELVGTYLTDEEEP